MVPAAELISLCSTINVQRNLYTCRWRCTEQHTRSALDAPCADGKPGPATGVLPNKLSELSFSVQARACLGFSPKCADLGRANQRTLTRVDATGGCKPCSQIRIKPERAGSVGRSELIQIESCVFDRTAAEPSNMASALACKSFAGASLRSAVPTSGQVSRPSRTVQ